MSIVLESEYQLIRAGRAGFFEQPCGLISVWGKEAVPFLDGMITNDMKTLEDGAQMLAAFPNAQGRMLALVRVRRQADRYLFDTEHATREKLFQNLFRFTFAGDFFVEDLSDTHSYFEIFGPKQDVYNPNVGERWDGAIVYELPYGASYFVPSGQADEFRSFLADENGYVAISAELYETLRIESGIPKYGVDMDETTIVPELGLDGLISYNKGCYIGQEIIARIHFRGHVAKKLKGLVLSAGPAQVGSELTAPDLKSAGRITSVGFSPKIDRNIALGYVRYDYAEEGRLLLTGENVAFVKDLPII